MTYQGKIRHFWLLILNYGCTPNNAALIKIIENVTLRKDKSSEHFWSFNFPKQHYELFKWSKFLNSSKPNCFQEFNNSKLLEISSALPCKSVIHFFLFATSKKYI